MVPNPVFSGFASRAASLCTAELLSSRLLSLLNPDLPCATRVFNSSALWLRLFFALQGNYCDLENCNSYPGSDVWQSNKVLLIVVIHGVVSKVQPIT